MAGNSNASNRFEPSFNPQISSAKADNFCYFSYSVQGGGDLFKETVPLCESSWKVIEAVFPNPQQVMAKLVLNIYHSRLKDHVRNRLIEKNSEQYLTNLYQLYSSTVKLTSDLSKFNLGSDHLFLSNLTKTIFRGYLDNYINVECRFLNERCAIILQRYYEKKGHQKVRITIYLTLLKTIR